MMRRESYRFMEKVVNFFLYVIGGTVCDNVFVIVVILEAINYNQIGSAIVF